MSVTDEKLVLSLSSGTISRVGLFASTKVGPAGQVALNPILGMVYTGPWIWVWDMGQGHGHGPWDIQYTGPWVSHKDINSECNNEPHGSLEVALKKRRRKKRNVY